MDESAFVKYVTHKAENGDVKFTIMTKDIDHTGKMPFLYNLFLADMDQCALCLGINRMCALPLSRGSFLAIGNVGRDLSQYIKMPDLSGRSYLCEDVPEDVVIIAPESAWQALLSKDANAKLRCELIEAHNKKLIKAFEHFISLAYLF